MSLRVFFLQHRGVLLILACFILIPSSAGSDDNSPFRFVVIGDSGCGCTGQQLVADRMLAWYRQKPFKFVFMTGDNIYGEVFYRGFFFFRRRGGDPVLFESRFDRFYAPLIKQGVKFYAALGNHDYETRDGRGLIEDTQRFNIEGDKGYYKVSPNTEAADLVDFFVLNSMRLIDGSDSDQVAWLSRELASSDKKWKIAVFHHPIYTAPGKHSPAETFLKFIEPIFVSSGVKVTFAGHNHFYSRIKPQKGITHFTTGGGGRSLKTPRNSPITAKIGRSYHFMYLEVLPHRLDFWVVPPQGPFLDKGSILP